MEKWKEDAERASGAPIAIARVTLLAERNRVEAPDGVPYPPVLARYLADASFRAQLAAAHALTLNYEGAEGRAHYVLLNQGTAAQWKDHEDGLVAHELGHIWLHARGFRAPLLEEGKPACLTILTGDIPQHILIRREARRREMDPRPYLISKLKVDLDNLEKAAATRIEGCQRLVALGHWLDMRLGLEPGDWDGQARLEALYADHWAAIRPAADRLTELLKAADLEDPEGFARAMATVGEELQKMFRPE